MADQTSFTAALLNAEQPVPAGIIRPDGTPATKRFDVYRNNVVTSLIGAMGDAFPVIKKLVGEAFFDAVAGHYVRAHPPTSPLIMFYGEGFAQFLETFEPAQQLPYLPDMARLEHARRAAYHAADDPVASPDALAQIDPEKLGEVRLKLHASVRIVPSVHPIFSIWRFNSTDDQTPIVANAEDVLICRPTDDVVMQMLPSGGAHFLTALQSGLTLEAAAQTASESQANFDLSQNIGGMLSAQILSEIQDQ
jgi:hypothetical protein